MSEERVTEEKTITDKEIELLFGKSNGKVKIGRQSFPIHVFNVKETYFVLKEVGVLIPIFAQNMDPETGEVLLTPTSLIGLLTEVFDNVINVVAMCLKLDREIVERFDNDTFLKVVIEIIRVNSSFFEKRVKGTVENAKELIQADLQTTKPSAS